MIITKKSYLFIGILLILALTACTTPTSIATQTQPPVSEQATQYPYPPIASVNKPAYPNPVTDPTSAAIVQPTPTTDPKMGSVTGQLLLNNKGVNDVLLYLAGVLKDKSGKDIVAGLDRVSSPNISTDSEGKFNFVNVPPGRYALILDAATTQYLLNYPNKETTIFVDVVVGKVIDLGALNYDTLPLPQK